MHNINDLREMLINELMNVPKEPTEADVKRIELKLGITDRVVDLTRVEVQLAAVLKGSMELPFIEASQAERPNGERRDQPTQLPPAAADGEALTPTERMAQTLSGGPSADHPWRKSLRDTSS